MKPFKLYHNPQCSKSREALQMVRDAGVECEIIEYLKTPPTEEELKHLIHELKSPLSELVRTKEAEFQADPFDTSSEDQVAKWIAKTPRLLERPILRGPHGTVIGRPLERIAELLKS